ncbi:FAP272 [Auxenochlorella protothecoides x Auxenochlorella symbiontica]|uniref:Calmodulin n=1 Tax=Auxenochlorella protothecoides TaxID=3075 RepID=A0A087SKI4_AUXPR|nr:Calmodulin [Auxenochlorella protothecoides]KFM26238.1 Calmodulin [Auxenochlorella protothecoides]RMZ56825.1 hypothetical protein APUTEX25_002914 [Auxenochlorella protothecoides]|eukprot:RMZ56825.1 hypothetical protein APUTEX25_002914 [Auxenochlorella protothecoides]
MRTAENGTLDEAREALQNLAPQKLEELKRAFAVYDKDGNGSIDAGELRGLLQSLGQYPTPLELIDMMERMDTDGSGAVDFLEFATCLAENDETAELEEEVRELESVFLLFDKDGSGQLSADEIQKALKLLGVDMTAQETAFLVQEIDGDGNGEISFQEFLDYVVAFQGPVDD